MYSSPESLAKYFSGIEPLQLVYHDIELCFQLAVIVLRVKHCRRGHPVPEEVTAQLTRGRLPAKVHIFKITVYADRRLKIKILQQRLGLELHKISTVYIGALLEQSREQTRVFGFNLSYHCFPPLLMVLLWGRTMLYRRMTCLRTGSRFLPLSCRRCTRMRT